MANNLQKLSFYSTSLLRDDKSVGSKVLAAGALKTNYKHSGRQCKEGFNRMQAQIQGILS
jgi:hypothetical protein